MQREELEKLFEFDAEIGAFTDKANAGIKAMEH